MLNAVDGVSAFEVRTPDDLIRADGLVIPGGESTAMGLVAQVCIFFLSIHKLEPKYNQCTFANHCLPTKLPWKIVTLFKICGSFCFGF